MRDVGFVDHISFRAIFLQQKTQHPVQLEISAPTRDAISAWIKQAQLQPNAFLLPSRIRNSDHLSIRQYARILNACLEGIGLDVAADAAHTTRRTKATVICRHAKNLLAVQLLLGRNELESTVRRLGIEVEDAHEIAEQTEA